MPASTPSTPPSNPPPPPASPSYKLGDKGDGTPASKADALQRHAHLNSTHVPDVIRSGARIDPYEWKCWSIFLAGGSLGLGSTRLGGAASTAGDGAWGVGLAPPPVLFLPLSPQSPLLKPSPWATRHIKGTKIQEMSTLVTVI